MRICPKCGHIDPIWWRPARRGPEFSYSHSTSLESMEPELWAKLRDLKPGELIVVESYVYWKSIRSDSTLRIWVEDFKMVGKSGSPMERVSHDPQLTLIEVLKPR